MHIFEDHFLPEIIDPDTGEVLPAGEKGELVFTNAYQRSPFQSSAIVPKIFPRLYYEPCACGRTLVRMEKVTGRTDDMLIIRGGECFPISG